MHKNKSTKKKFYKKWWFVLFIAPFIVAATVGIMLIFVKSKHQEKGNSTINISGDFVAGDKYDISLSNPIEYKDLDRIYIENVKVKINRLKRKYSESKITILFEIINANNETKRFANEFKRIMEELGISVRVVPHMMIGLPPTDFPLYFKYRELKKDLVMDFIWSIEQIFSPVKSPIKISKPIEDINIPEGFNLVIRIYDNVFFDQKGRIYFNTN